VRGRAIDGSDRRYGIRGRREVVSYVREKDKVMSSNWWPDDPPLYYDAHVLVCCNRRPDWHKRGSCAAKGPEKLGDYMKVCVKELGLEHVRVNLAGRLPEGIWYKVESTADVDAILERHLVDMGGWQSY
jgi:hypothetical protein